MQPPLGERPGPNLNLAAPLQWDPGGQGSVGALQAWECPSSGLTKWVKMDVRPWLEEEPPALLPHLLNPVHPQTGAIAAPRPAPSPAPEGARESPCSSSLSRG